MADPVVTVLVDWAKNGSWADSIDDITSDVLELRWQRGSIDWAGGDQPGTAQIVVDNSSLKYNPENSGGPLYGNILPGRPVWIKAVYNSVTYGIFGGYLDRIIPTVSGGAKEAQLLCVDEFAYWARRNTYLDASGDDINDVGAVRSTIMTRLGVSQTVLPSVESMWALYEVGSRSRDAMGLVADLNRAVATRHAIVPSTTTPGWKYLAVGREHKLSATVDETLTTVQAVDGYELSGEGVINSPTATYSRIEPSAVPGLIWQSAGPFPITIPASTTWTATPTFDQLYVDIYGSVSYTGSTPTVVVRDEGMAAPVSITAGGGGPTYVTGVSIYGALANESMPTEVNSSNSASIAIYGERSGGTAVSSFLRTYTMAKGLTDFLLWRFMNCRVRPRITVMQQFPTVLAREMFDVIALTVSALSVSARRYEIVAIDGSLSRSHVWSVVYTLLEMTEQTPLTGWFTLGTSALDGTDKLAY